MSNDEELTEQEEIYAQGRARGMTKTDSAKKAYPDDKYPRQAGYKAEKRERVINRIIELKLERQELNDLDFKEQVRRYNEIYHALMNDKKYSQAAKILERMDSLGGFDASTRHINVSMNSKDLLKDISGNLDLDIERFSGVLAKHSQRTPVLDVMENIVDKDS